MSALDWVKARAACTLESNFFIIEKALKNDIKAFNRLTPVSRGGRLFIVTNHDKGIDIRRAKRIDDYRGSQTIIDDNYDQDFVRIEYGNGAIVAKRQDRFTLTIRPRWNAASLACDLYIEDDAFPLWNVSEQILEPFLFDEAA